MKKAKKPALREMKVSQQIRDLQKRIDQLEEAHSPPTKTSTLKRPALKKLTRILRDGSGSRVKQAAQDVAERLIVLGFNDNLLFTINRPNSAEHGYQEIIVDIPDGTTHVLAFMRGWLSGFVNTDIGELAESGVQGIVDHHLGLAYANVRVKEVGLTTATIAADMVLRDKNGDDKWAGWVNAGVIYLGSHP